MATLRVKPAVHPDCLTQLEHALHFAFSYFCDNRNAAGHPSGTAFNREQLASDLMNWLAKNKPI